MFGFFKCIISIGLEDGLCLFHLFFFLADLWFTSCLHKTFPINSVTWVNFNKCSLFTEHARFSWPWVLSTFVRSCFASTLCFEWNFSEGGLNDLMVRGMAFHFMTAKDYVDFKVVLSALFLCNQITIIILDAARYYDSMSRCLFHINLVDSICTFTAQRPLNSSVSLYSAVSVH